jgi:GcrA cell cycle regulator
MESTNWPPEHSAALRKLRLRGMSYGTIAATLNARFNTVYTRSAALSRGQRMGLGCYDRPEPSLPGLPERPESSPAPQLPATERTREVRPEARIDMLRRPKFFFENQALPELRCAGVAPRHVSLVELKRGDCRYPYGGDRDDEPITFCGHPRQPGASYCTPHFRLSRNPELSARPVLSAAWLHVVGAD